MNNVKYKVDKNILTIIVDLTERHGLSGSGNTITIASTQGNQKIGQADIAMGLSVYTKEGLIQERIKSAQARGYKTWEDLQAAIKSGAE